MARIRTKKAECRMTEEEFEKYSKQVEKSKLSKQKYNLKVLLNKDIYVVDGIQELAMQIRKIGVNINQVVHLANEDSKLDKEQVEKLNDKMNDVWKLLNDFAKSIKR